MHALITDAWQLALRQLWQLVASPAGAGDGHSSNPQTLKQVVQLHVEARRSQTSAPAM
jgi:hypothetical protein